jgi:hypothetical protein
MTVTNKKLIGNHALASDVPKLRNEMIPRFFTTKTHMTQTVDWMHKRRKFMEKLRPETTYCAGLSISILAPPRQQRGIKKRKEKNLGYALC